MDRYLHYRSLEVLTINLSDETSSETETKKLMAFCNCHSNESTQVFFFSLFFFGPETVEMVSKVYHRNNGVKLLSFALKPQNRMRNKKVSCYL